MAPEAAVIRVTVADGRVEPPRVVDITLPAGSTVAVALRAAQLDAGDAALGVFNRPSASDGVLVDGDRVEIYRSLTIDPKEARRVRAAVRAQRARGSAPSGS